jgi:hypothetical protein
VFVVGSAGAGKTSVALHFLLGPGGLREHMRAVSGGAEARQSPRPTAAPAHFAAAQPIGAEGADGAGAGSAGAGAGAGADASFAPVLPFLASTLAITEWPATMLEAALGTGAGADARAGSGAAAGARACAADAVGCVVDPARAESLDYLRRCAALLPDGVPLAVVAASHVELDGRQPEAKRGMDALRALCEGAAPAAAGAAGAPPAAGAGEEPLPPLPLRVGLFPFFPKAKVGLSLELFRFLSERSVLPGADNPRTGARRQRERDAAFRRRARAAAAALAGVAGLALALALAADFRGMRSGLRDAITRMRGVAK